MSSATILLNFFRINILHTTEDMSLVIHFYHMFLLKRKLNEIYAGKKSRPRNYAITDKTENTCTAKS